MEKQLNVFPDQVNDILCEIENIKVNTNFSYMGESDGIEITCEVSCKTKTHTILMHPDWESGEITANLKKKFPNGYYIFEEYKKEKIHYHFIVDYEKENELFKLKIIKKSEEPNHYYINSIEKRYTKEAIKQFEEQLCNKLIKKYIKKRSY